MAKKEEAVVHYNDAPIEFKTDISGWVDANGRYWGDNEHQARWSSCNTLDCQTEDCVNTVKRNSFIICDPCREERRKAKYAELARKQWDGTGLVYSDAHDKYFEDYQGLHDYLEEENLTVEQLDLVLCRPINIRELDEDHFTEDLHEDAELPSEISDAITKLNELIGNHGKAQSWMPDKYAAIVNI
jgi:hypothetical protein